MNTRKSKPRNQPKNFSPEAVTTFAGIRPSGPISTPEPTQCDRKGDLSPVIGMARQGSDHKQKPLKSNPKPLPPAIRSASEVRKEFLARRWPKRTLAERFWQKVAMGSPTACWPWTASRYPQGYGHFQLGVGRKIYAHRQAYLLHYGNIPKGLGVLHHCDNPPCCNPAHLWVGTHQQNMADMMAKGRRHKPKTEGK